MTMIEHDRLQTVSTTLRELLGAVVAHRICALLVTDQLRRSRSLLEWPYDGWTTPKPLTYKCPDNIWRRMPLCLQQTQIRISEAVPGHEIRWCPGMGADLEDFEAWRRGNFLALAD